MINILLAILISGSVSAGYENKVIPFFPTGTIIQDPSFEAGPNGGIWTENSTNFGTPICEVIVCSEGGGTGANSGGFWVFFGGAHFFEEASVSQSVTLPNNSIITLNFFLQIPFCEVDGFMAVIVDGNQEFIVDETSPLCNVLGYSQQSVDLFEYSGQTIDLEFHSITNQLGAAANVNFFIDDISVEIVNAGSPTIIPSLQTWGIITLSFFVFSLAYIRQRKFWGKWDQYPFIYQHIDL